MRYLCVHCDEKFELTDEQEARCPKCMRLHGLRALGTLGPGADRSPRWRWAVGAGLLLLAALGGGGYAFFTHAAVPSATELAAGPLSDDVLTRELTRRGVRADGADAILRRDAAIERFAHAAVAGKKSADEKAAAIFEALRARAKASAFVTWSLTEPRDGAPMVAAEVLPAIQKDGAAKQLYPLETAALGVAALRGEDVPAMLVELYAWPGQRTPLDPSGRFGYFAIGLRGAQGSLQVFDVHGGRPALHACTDCAVLTDLEAVGAALSLRAAHGVAQNDDPARALRDADAAAKLWPSSPTVRGAHGAVLLAGGARDLGQNELEAAAQLRPDATRRNNLAILHLALGDTERATQEVARALERDPDFAAAHATLAQVHLSRGERDLAEAELQKAEALDPKLPILPLTWAQFYASAGQHDQAIEYGRRAAELRARDPQVHLMLAQIYRQASRYEDMRSEARSALALAPQAIAAQMRELIGRMLGPTALEDAPTPAAPGAASPAPDAPPLAPSAAPKLRLTEPGTGLKLRDPTR